MYEPITTQRLDDFGAVMREYNTLKIQKEKLTQKLGLSGVDYSKIKVTTGNQRKLSEEERYVLILEKINTKMQEYEEWLKPEKKVIISQIGRIRRSEYRKVLILRYVDRWKWSDIIQECFWFEKDFEEEKNDKYRTRVFQWHKAALKQLEEISATPYIPTAQQLTLIGKEEE